ncbi:hypothetical protein GCM10023085_68710 [Actinomadura viridis]|uniref:Cell division protein FtsL n=1 Tax=Actinomadura viridis TaxID=58110 RepID=A0A931DC66_9ACTN|nr:hypothetical protein [Actinomadura viridis]MBG6088409.1 hypothetical protein [Actinomadura viridis]
MTTTTRRPRGSKAPTPVRARPERGGGTGGSAPVPASGAEAGTEAKTEARPKAAPKGGTRTVPKSAPKAAPKTGARTASKAGAEAGPKASPQAGTKTRAKAAAAAGQAERRTGRSSPPRAPFVLLICGLMGGALVSLLLLNTVLAEDAFTLTRLQQNNKLLGQQRQALQEEIAREESPERVAQKAEALGMQRPTRLAFIDGVTGQVIGGSMRPVPHAAAAAAGAAGVVGIPGAVVPGDGVSAAADRAAAAPGSRTGAPARPAGTGAGTADRTGTGTP